MTERDLFSELQSSLKDVREFEQGKLTLKTTHLEARPSVRLNAEQIRSIREKYNMSRAVFAHYLHVSTRTLEKWEQGVSKPNEQASTLIALTAKYPDMIERLQSV
ncbi:MAG: helix-turn-helix domain-containing protein [Hydrogenovibrio sp.]